jgi:hypothetical protein
MTKCSKDSRNIKRNAYRATVSNVYGILFVVIKTACTTSMRPERTPRNAFSRAQHISQVYQIRYEIGIGRYWLEMFQQQS